MSNTKESTILKQELCKQYEMYLYIILQIGKGVVLQKQLLQVLSSYDKTKSHSTFRRNLKNLEEAEIIGFRENFGTNNTEIYLRKFALKYFNNNKLSLCTKKREQIYSRIIKSCYSIEIFIKLLENNNFDSVIKYFKNSSYSLKNGAGMEFANNLETKNLIYINKIDNVNDKAFLKYNYQKTLYMIADKYKKEIRFNKELTEQQVTEYNLVIDKADTYKKAISSTNNKKEISLNLYTFNTFLNSNIYLFYYNNTNLKFYIFDVSEADINNIYLAIEHVIYLFYCYLINKNVAFNFVIFTKTNAQMSRLIEQQNQRRYNYLDRSFSVKTFKEEFKDNLFKFGVKDLPVVRFVTLDLDIKYSLKT